MVCGLITSFTFVVKAKCSCTSVATALLHVSSLLLPSLAAFHALPIMPHPIKDRLPYGSSSPPTRTSLGLKILGQLLPISRDFYAWIVRHKFVSNRAKMAPFPSDAGFTLAGIISRLNIMGSFTACSPLKSNTSTPQIRLLGTGTFRSCTVVRSKSVGGPCKFNF